MDIVKTVNVDGRESIRCPDGNFCQDGQTCCLLSGGRYGCCPYPHAVCCSDHASCCPEGYRCKVSTRSCVAGNSTLPMLKKIDTIGGSPLKEPVPVERVRCPDGNYCQDGQTCCLTTGGRFGCCPYPHAECCSDYASCCPEGYRCKVSTRSCVAGNSTLPMLKKIDTIGGSPLKEPVPGCCPPYGVVTPTVANAYELPIHFPKNTPAHWTRKKEFHVPRKPCEPVATSAELEVPKRAVGSAVIGVETSCPDDGCDQPRGLAPVDEYRVSIFSRRSAAMMHARQQNA
ncbi:progranulin isoform X5 [Ixodes scapularis]